MPLTLSRKTGESLIIGDNIRVTVTMIRGNRARIAIAAPPEVKVVREELLNARKPEAGDRGQEASGLEGVGDRSALRD